MEDNKKSQTKMKEIPAFTVLKNNSILKNIFLLHKQQSSSNQDSDEQILLVGRHPNCNITLEHPSISRYHLRIHSNPSTRSLSVFDLSSVHGTWVSGKRIEPGVHVELKEGDKVKMGGSSRVYELHWVPVSRAYDDDGQFMSTIYTIKEAEEEMNQDEKLEFHMSDDELERSELSFSDMIHHDSPVKKLDLLTSSDPDCLTSSCDDTEVECSSPSKAGNGAISIIDDSDSLNTSENQSNLSSENMSAELKMLNRETDKDGLLFCDDTVLIQPTLAVSETISAIEDSVSLNKSEDELNWLRDNLSNESEQLVYGTMKDGLMSVACFDLTKPHEKDALSQDIERRNEIEPVNQQTINNVSVPVALSDNVNRDEDESFMPDTAESKEANVDSELEQMNHIKMANESAVTVVLIDGADMGNKLELIDHEITKKESVFMALPDGTDLDLEQSFTPDISREKEFHTNRIVKKNVSVSMNLFNTLDGNELEFFTLDKENKNPNAFSVKSLNKGPMEDVSSPIVNKENNNISFSKQLLTSVDESYSAFLQRSLNDVEKVDPFVYCEELLLSSSEKETKSRQLETEGSCYPQTVQKVIDSSHNVQGGAKKRWTMVVDASSLLHVESLKHFKLLEGLKGTQIVVPKIVIRELMDIQSQDNILKRSTEKVSLALKWIDECMANTRWWILMDDEILRSSELGSEVLETALHLRNEISDRKIIILSNDLTLKIKAMAEGIMCEAAEEFHRSLVNPFSERFMWVGSSARGLTWSSINDDILRQKYHGCGLNGSRGLKGLKLLAHDINFLREV